MKAARLNQGDRDACESPEAARALVLGYKKEVIFYKESLVKTQNESTTWQEKYHSTHADNQVLNALQNTFLLTEIIKFALSAIGTGYGVNLASSGKGWGWAFIGGSGIVYALITWGQAKAKPTKEQASDATIS